MGRACKPVGSTLMGNRSPWAGGETSIVNEIMRQRLVSEVRARRSNGRSGLAFVISHATTGTSMAKLLHQAGRRVGIKSVRCDSLEE